MGKKNVAVQESFDIHSKSRGYQCTLQTEEAAIKALQSLYYENEKFWRNAKQENKKSMPFDCYCIATNRKTGATRLVELYFREDTETDDDVTYEEVVAQSE